MKKALVAIALIGVSHAIAHVPQTIVRNDSGGPIEFLVRCFPSQSMVEHGVIANGTSMPVTMVCPDDIMQLPSFDKDKLLRCLDEQKD